MAQCLRGYAHLPQRVMCSKSYAFWRYFTSFYARQWYDVTNDVTRA